jgi:hypothetical protein
VKVIIIKILGIIVTGLWTNLIVLASITVVDEFENTEATDSTRLNSTRLDSTDSTRLGFRMYLSGTVHF